ncbi:MAG: hypothetical protein WD768_01125 [Phycisphaeraceae bacterium]
MNHGTRLTLFLTALLACLFSLGCEPRGETPTQRADHAHGPGHRHTHETPAPPEKDEPLDTQLAQARAGQLDFVRLWFAPATDAEAQIIADTPGIIRVIFNNTTITDAGLAALATMPALETLRLRSAIVTDAGLASLAACKTLRHLILVDARITDAGLLRLKDWPALESLYLIDTGVTDEGVAALLQQRPALHVHW